MDVITITNTDFLFVFFSLRDISRFACSSNKAVIPRQASGNNKLGVPRHGSWRNLLHTSRYSMSKRAEFRCGCLLRSFLWEYTLTLIMKSWSGYFTISNLIIHELRNNYYHINNDKYIKIKTISESSLDLYYAVFWMFWPTLF